MARIPSSKAMLAFVTTAQSLNITHAAETLNLTQGAISRQLSNFEQELGVTLFHRQARGLALTSAGRQLLPEISQALQRIQHSIDQLATNHRRIRLKAPSCVTYWLMPKLADFHGRHPSLEVELTSTTKHDVNFLTEQFDAAICFGHRSISQGTDRHWLLDEVLTPMCTPDIAKTLDSANLLQSLTEHTWLHANQEHADWQLWLAGTGHENVQAERNQIFATLDMATSAAARGFGIVVGDVNLAIHELESGRLITPSPIQIKTNNSYFLQIPQDNQTPAAITLLKDLFS
ncbi:LysR substrate-binding domain-containing protein [Reinekea sp.]|uniref:LysR substrate-binding domain-containing protein n=3 Tax=Reinekea sp. TaxID=1970455 RepID=UPI003988E0D1